MYVACRLQLKVSSRVFSGQREINGQRWKLRCAGSSREHLTTSVLGMNRNKAKWISRQPLWSHLSHGSKSAQATGSYVYWRPKLLSPVRHFFHIAWVASWPHQKGVVQERQWAATQQHVCISELHRRASSTCSLLYQGPKEQTNHMIHCNLGLKSHLRGFHILIELPNPGTVHQPESFSL